MHKLTLTALAAALMLAVSAPAEPPAGWTNNFEGAKTQAQESDRDMLINFTGSDWCGWCIRLKEEVFQHPTFEFSAPEHFVLVYLDYPSSTSQPPHIKRQNESLAERYEIKGFPTIMLADSQGTPYALTGYQEGGPESYMQHLDKLRSIREARDAAMLKGKRAEGADRAKAFDEALEAVGDELAMEYYRNVIEEILQLDIKDEAGLRTKYQQKFISIQFDEKINEAMGQYMKGDADGALRALNALLTKANLPTEKKQIITAIRGRIYMDQGDAREGRIQLRRAIDIDPESDVAKEIKAFLDSTQ